MRYPNALIIGPMRSASTWIHRYLKNREDVCLPKDVKETFFFDRRFNKEIKWYLSHFQDCDKDSVGRVVEVGPSYFHSARAPERIKKTLGLIPLLVTYRDPVERSVSHYAHLRQYGFTNLPLREAVKEFPEIITASRYAEQLERWVDHFNLDCLRILQLNTLKSSPEEFASNLTEALNLPYKAVPENLKSRVNCSSIPEKNFLFGLAWSVADVLRGWRLHKIVEWGKDIGIKELMMQEGEDARVKTGDQEREWIRYQLKEDIQRAKEVISKINQH